MTDFILSREFLCGLTIGLLWGIFITFAIAVYVVQSKTRRAVRADVDRHMAGIRTNLKQGG